tara:strand:- start:1905 stop:2273 length:369 start_codon:yes stop_codon:yes gene_type:complete
MSNNALKESALAKLEKLGLTKEEVLSLVDEGEETIVMEDGESMSESKSWQQIVMEEHVKYYNKRYNTDYNFDEYYEGVTNGKLDVHYKWKELLGLVKKDDIKPNDNANLEKFKKFGNEESGA